ncbi:hypothetical protein [Brachybacterium hainanense]|uniref:AAA domain-containing protein n=1 Tax=Brachybacterium hainanense TaxID=1541174 RepID=A0ABV6RAZ8_9MICO
MIPSPQAAPLLRIAAPPGTGKTTVLPHLVGLARGRAVVADIDEILEDGSLLGVPIAVPEAAPIWPAYDRLWSRIAGFVRRAGVPVILLVQVPDPGDPDGDGVLLGWELEDAVRGRRLRDRGEPETVIAGAREDAAVLRGLVPADRLLRSSETDTPEQAATGLWRLAEPLLPRG